MTGSMTHRGDEKRIILHIGFWTDKLPKEKDDGKTAWMKGTIYLRANKRRGIRPKDTKFNNEKQFLSKMQALLRARGVRLLDITEPHEPIDLTEL